MDVETTSIIISRKPREGDNEYKTVSLAFYDQNDGHLAAVPPTETKDFPDTEKVLIKNLDISYYSEGNDLIINDLSSVTIEEDGSTLVISGEKK